MAEKKSKGGKAGNEATAADVSRRAMLKSSFSTAVVGLFFGTVGCGDDQADPGAEDGCYPFTGCRGADGPAGTGGGSSTTLCTNTCNYPNDGDCDDGGLNSVYGLCELGTDCNDCGPRAGSSYSDTSYSDTSYSNYSDYSDYSNYSDSYYNYSDYVYYYNYFSNSW